MSNNDIETMKDISRRILALTIFMTPLFYGVLASINENVSGLFISRLNSVDGPLALAGSLVGFLGVLWFAKNFRLVFTALFCLSYGLVRKIY